MIKLLIVDDSETEVQLIRQIIKDETDLLVIGVAKNGKEAIELTKLLKPDLITMDIRMPVMDGLEATRQIMSQCPTPIVVISSTVSDDSLNATYPILEAGALSALAKPRDVFSPVFASTKKYIIATLKSMAEIKVARKKIRNESNHERLHSPDAKNGKTPYEVVAIGVSVGGPMALKTIFSELPVDFPLPIVVVQHMTAGFISGYVKWLANVSGLQVKEAEHLEILKKGTIYVAPDGRHFQIERVGGQLQVKLFHGDLVDGFCPSITVLLNSVATSCKNTALGMLLTGMGSDGAAGLLAIKNAKGHTCIQDPESAVVFGMAGVAQSMGAVDQVVPLDKIAKYLIDVCN